MPITPAVAGLAMSVVTGAVKLGRRLDEIAAEETALTSTLNLELPPVRLQHDIFQMRDALVDLLAETATDDPDPLADEREAIEEATDDIAADGAFDDLFNFCRTYGALDQSDTRLFAPDAEFAEALRKRNAAWNLDDADILQYTFYVSAGASRRRTSVGFQIGAAILDVVAEVAAANTGLVIEHEPTRKLVAGVLARFSEPDLSTMSGWGDVLKHALRVTLNSVIDEREALAGGRVWIERALSAVANVREQAPNGDDFVLGLLRGNGINELISGLLVEGADYLSEGDEEVWETILSDVLLTAAAQAQDSADFEEFFQENWHALVGAGLTSLGEHGTRLLDDSELLKTTLVATVKSLAESFTAGPPTGETLTAAVQTAIGVFSDSDVLAPSVRQKWLREMIAGVATVIRDEGLRTAFSQPALERYARGALEVLARNPEVIATDSEIVNKILDNVLRKLTTIETFAVGPLADVAVGGVLAAIADNPGLIDRKYASVIGDLASELADRVANGGISSFQANEILEIAAEIVATNEFVFLEARKGLSGAIVKAITDILATDDGARLIAGSAAVTIVERLLTQFAQTGLGLPSNMTQLATQVHHLLAAGLADAKELLGKKLAQSDLSELLVALVTKLARGEGIPTPGTTEFTERIETLAQGIAARAA